MFSSLLSVQEQVHAGLGTVASVLKRCFAYKLCHSYISKDFNLIRYHSAERNSGREGHRNPEGASRDQAAEPSLGSQTGSTIKHGK
eukprot:1037049-Pelagomonas_calceolata.AAC.6